MRVRRGRHANNFSTLSHRTHTHTLPLSPSLSLLHTSIHTLSYSLTSNSSLCMLVVSTVAVRLMNLGEIALLRLCSVAELDSGEFGSADLPRIPRGREAERENAALSGRVREVVGSS